MRDGDMKIRGNVHKGHEPRHKAVPCPVKDAQEGPEEGCDQNTTNRPAFEQIRHEETRRSLVEPVLFLEDLASDVSKLERNGQSDSWNEQMCCTLTEAELEETKGKTAKRRSR